MTQIRDKNRELLAEIFVQKEGVNNWGVIHLNRNKSVIKSEYGLSYWVANALKRTWVLEFKQNIKAKQ